MKIMKIRMKEMFSKTKYYLKLISIFAISLICVKINLEISFIVLFLGVLILTMLYYYMVFAHDKILFSKLKDILIKKI